MRDDHRLEKMRKSIERMGEQPFSEFLANMIKRGIMNEKGEVIVRMPEPPEYLTNGKKNAAKKKKRA